MYRVEVQLSMYEFVKTPDVQRLLEE